MTLRNEIFVGQCMFGSFVVRVDACTTLSEHAGNETGFVLLSIIVFV